MKLLYRSPLQQKSKNTIEGVMAVLDSISKLFLDPYDRPARLTPGLLVCVPAPVLIVCLYGTAHIIANSAVAALGFCGAGYAIARIARDAGKRLQDKLFAKWGGPPTTQLLRYRNTHFDVHTKERFHEVLSKGFGKPMPTPDAERSDPAAADELYRGAIGWLIGQTPDTKTFPLVFKENIAFGFHRNSLGLRIHGVVVGAVCLALALLHSNVLGFMPPYFSGERIQNLDPATMITLSVSVVMLLAWIFWLNEGATKRAGFSYAERLLQSCFSLIPTAAKAPRTPKKKTP